MSNFFDSPCSGRQVAPINKFKDKQPDALITVSRRITVAEFCENLHVRQGSGYSFAHRLGYSKVCVKWVLM